MKRLVNDISLPRTYGISGMKPKNKNEKKVILYKYINEKYKHTHDSEFVASYIEDVKKETTWPYSLE